MKKNRLSLIRILILIGFLSFPVFSSPQSASNQEIDWLKAQEIRQKQRQGASLTPEEREYLEFAEQWRRKRTEEFRATHPPRESIGLIPLTELGTAVYKGDEGGLYPGGRNLPPEPHREAGRKAAGEIAARNSEGQPSEEGKIVLLSVGMSNTTQEFQLFQKLAAADPDLNPRLVIVDGAQGGQAADVTADPDTRYWRVVDERLQAAGVTRPQVQAVWLKQATRGPSRPFPQEVQQLKAYLLSTVHHLRDRFPNLKIAYLSSRIYAGYAETPLNPEPHAYETAFAVKWLVAEQIAGKPELNYAPAKGSVRAPWLAWGPYLWTDGMKTRGDGLTYTREDLAGDGTHPSATGRQKVAQLLLSFLKKDPASRPWFLSSEGQRRSKPRPDYENVQYGPHERNVLDLWQAKSAEPTPLVLYIHGGGFRGGDKGSLRADRLKAYLEAGFSVAAINYRLTDTAPAPAAYLDCARALQFLRAGAKEWNLDPSLVASTGGSAGAGTSMWLAFHDDLADPQSENPVGRESTRLTCIVVDNGQSSYDPRFAEKIGIPRPNFERHAFFLPFYDITQEEIDTAKAYKRYEEAAPITYLSKDDPPAMLNYTYPNEEVTEKTPLNLIVHHPKLGIALREQMDKLGVECIVQYVGQPEAKPVEAVDFIRKHFERAKEQ